MSDFRFYPGLRLWDYRNGVDWDVVEEHFEVSSGLNLDTRDIFVQDCTLTDWDKFLQWLTNEGLGTFWELDSEIAEPHFESASQVFDKRLTTTVALFFKVGDVLIRSFFYHPSEIELDFYAGYVKNETTLSALIWFIKNLGQLFRREVVVSFSEVPDGSDWIIRYDPEANTVLVRTGRVPMNSPDWVGP